MDIEVSPVPLEHKPVLRHMFELYRYDFSAFDKSTHKSNYTFNVPEPPRSPQTHDTGPRGVWERLRRWMGGS